MSTQLVAHNILANYHAKIKTNGKIIFDMYNNNWAKDFPVEVIRGKKLEQKKYLKKLDFVFTTRKITVL